MKKLKNIILSGLLSLGLVGLVGCETNSNDDSNYNRGQGRDKFSVYIGGHMYNNESKDIAVDVVPGATYHVNMECSNDGDSDLITVRINNQNLIEYKTDENRFGGSGWYHLQTTPKATFVSTSEVAIATVSTRTDGYGTWPQNLNFERVEE